MKNHETLHLKLPKKTHPNHPKYLLFGVWSSLLNLRATKVANYALILLLKVTARDQLYGAPGSQQIHKLLQKYS